jgi:putative transposase
MKDQNNTYVRKPIRLKDFDYSSPGAYFVTICTMDKECWFGKILYGEMILNQYGKLVKTIWDELASHFINIELDYHVIMPNHVHGIIFISSKNRGLIHQPPNIGK